MMSLPAKVEVSPCDKTFKKTVSYCGWLKNGEVEGNAGTLLKFQGSHRFNEFFLFEQDDPVECITEGSTPRLVSLRTPSGKSKITHLTISQNGT